MCSWDIFRARTNHGLDLGEATTFPLIILSMHSHKAYTQMSFYPRTFKLGVSKFMKLRLLQLWKPITFCANLRLRWGLKQSCNPCWEFSNNMLHDTFTQINQGDSWLLVVRSQIGNLTSGPSFGHNLCFNYPNGSYKPIIEIFIPRVFQWYKELFSPMSFNSCDCLLMIREFTGTPTPKMGVHLRVWGFIASHFLTLPGTWNVTLWLHSWPAPL